MVKNLLSFLVPSPVVTEAKDLSALLNSSIIRRLRQYGKKTALITQKKVLNALGECWIFTSNSA